MHQLLEYFGPLPNTAQDTATTQAEVLTKKANQNTCLPKYIPEVEEIQP